MKLISPEHIYHGVDCTDEINNIIEGSETEKVYILCDPIMEKLGSTDKIKSILEQHGLEYVLSTNVMAEPTVDKGNEIVEEVRSAEPDLIIGLGGGSTLDLVKAASLIALQEGTIENYLNLTGDRKLSKNKIPNILMPTTSGTSAEITDIAVFSTGDSKDAVTDPLMLATYAIIDPVYTYSLPPKVAAASSVDAFTHAIEAFTSVNATPITDHLAMGAMEKIYNNVREGVWDAKNYEAKDELSTASIMAGLSFYNAGVAGVHSLAYPLGGNFKIPHGESNAVLLPYVYNVIQKSCSNKLSRLAPIFKIDVSDKTSMEVSALIVEKLFGLIEDVGLPRNLRYYDIGEKDIDLLTKNAMKQTRLLVRSPLELKEEVIRRIYMDALEG